MLHRNWGLERLTTINQRQHQTPQNGNYPAITRVNLPWGTSWYWNYSPWTHLVTLEWTLFIRVQSGGENSYIKDIILSILSYQLFCFFLCLILKENHCCQSEPQQAWLSDVHPPGLVVTSLQSSFLTEHPLLSNKTFGIWDPRFSWPSACTPRLQAPEFL